MGVRPSTFLSPANAALEGRDACLLPRHPTANSRPEGSVVLPYFLQHDLTLHLKDPTPSPGSTTPSKSANLLGTDFLPLTHIHLSAHLTPL